MKMQEAMRVTRRLDVDPFNISPKSLREALAIVSAELRRRKAADRKAARHFRHLSRTWMEA